MGILKAEVTPVTRTDVIMEQLIRITLTQITSKSAYNRNRLSIQWAAALSPQSKS